MGLRQKRFVLDGLRCLGRAWCGLSCPSRCLRFLSSPLPCVSRFAAVRRRIGRRWWGQGRFPGLFFWRARGAKKRAGVVGFGERFAFFSGAGAGGFLGRVFQRRGCLGQGQRRFGLAGVFGWRAAAWVEPPLSLTFAFVPIPAPAPPAFRPRPRSAVRVAACPQWRGRAVMAGGAFPGRFSGLRGGRKKSALAKRAFLGCLPAFLRGGPVVLAAFPVRFSGVLRSEERV